MEMREKAASLARRVGSSVGGGVGRSAGTERINELEQRVSSLEEQLAESEMLNHRFAELLDIVSELLVPLAQHDDRARDTVQRYVDELGS